ncbi:MAG: SpoIIE family protein phosphatase [Candidatus Dadabacteria bacterium]|nr:SpoIIE family protein phosphatase [Candidatus Dadabacteria bacterium]NIS08562.1 SpoIIE family protein phosphatase [Candidatus Dadabacteria bacterium]NIV41390.1 SpoIIE family protein phosphatase [Candidatus Dadabacteria bacterium]NIX14597.1 SpoIIE family protein phosphatase [Candidatus Dadabacteria bacterium]NIY21052.1 SpoIIE family protein phosphatase [Candidatus Dadabacteria bacterium]
MSKLFKKTLIIIIILFGIIATLTSALSGWNIYNGLSKEFTSKGLSIATSISDSSVEILLNRDLSTLQSVIDQYLNIEGVSYVLVANNVGHVVSHTFVPSVPEEIIEKNTANNDSFLKEKHTIKHLSIKGKGEFIDISVPILGGVAGNVQVGMDKSIIKNEIVSIIIKQQVLMFLIFLLTIGLSYLFINRISKPLNALTEHVKTITTKDLTVQNINESLIKTLSDKSDDEIGDLARSFMNMEVELVDYINQLTETTAEKERIESELKIAHDIQMGFLPQKFPPFPERNEFEIFADLIPAKHVGGDFYDFFFLQDDDFTFRGNNKLFFVIGDVSGKGVPASLFMALTKTLLKAKASSDISPSQMLTAVNRELCIDNENCMFVTIFCGVLDIETGEIEYSNGGHNPPYIVSKSRGVKMLGGQTGTALGVHDEAKFVTYKEKIVADEGLYLFTDGVTEAMDVDYNLYSEQRLEDFLSALDGCCETELLVESSKAEVVKFTTGAEQSDDITIMAIKYLSQRQAV